MNLDKGLGEDSSSGRGLFKRACNLNRMFLPLQLARIARLAAPQGCRGRLLGQVLGME